MYQEYISTLQCIFVSIMKLHAQGILYHIKQLDRVSTLNRINRYIFLLESKYITSEIMQEIKAFISDNDVIINKPCINC
jgi:hypothetical protein